MLETIRRFADAESAVLLSWHPHDAESAVQVAPDSPTARLLPLSGALCVRLGAMRHAAAVGELNAALPEALRELWSAHKVTTFFAVVSPTQSEHAVDWDAGPTAHAKQTRIATADAVDQSTTVLLVGWRGSAAVDASVLPMLPRLLDAASHGAGALSGRDNLAQRLDALIRTTTHGVVFVDGAAGTAEVNERAATLLKVKAGTISALQLSVAIRERQEGLRDHHRIVDEYTRLVLGDDVSPPDWVWECDDAERTTWRVASAPVGSGARRARVWTFEDVTADRHTQRLLARQLEREELLNRQKLEAVMRLAGGVAHDFTNVLTVISGSVEMIRDLPIAREAEGDLAAIRQATLRANGLIRQLRAFSGQSVAQPDILLVDAVLQAMTPTLEGAVEAPWSLTLDVDAAGALIVMNERQFALTLLHLVERTRDGMPDGGPMVLRTTRVVLSGRVSATVAATVSATALNNAAAEATGDPYVVISLEEEDEAAERPLLHAFADETQPLGRGAEESGLGHATISAIVDQVGGHIRSALTSHGRRRFALFLPESNARHVLKVERTPARGTPIVAQKHHLPLLVVDDDAGPRRVMRRLLEREGYHILAAESGNDAWRQLTARGGQLSCVVTDYLMPGMSGMELLARVRRSWPELPVVLVSGFTSEEVTGTALRDLRSHFLPKPFTRDELLQAIATATLAVASR